MAPVHAKPRFTKVTTRDPIHYVADHEIAYTVKGYAVCDRTLYLDGKAIGTCCGVSTTMRKATEEERRDGKVYVGKGPWTITYVPTTFPP